MNCQWKWQRTTKKIDIEGLFRIRQETYLIQEGFDLPQEGFTLPQEG